MPIATAAITSRHRCGSTNIPTARLPSSTVRDAWHATQPPAFSSTNPTKGRRDALRRALSDPRPARRSHQRAISPFSAPEELKGERPGALTDLYGLAATLVFWLTGRLPHGGTDEGAALWTVTSRATSKGPEDTLQILIEEVFSDGLLNVMEAPEFAQSEKLRRVFAALDRYRLKGSART